jgi:hypothetical protein
MKLYQWLAYRLLLLCVCCGACNACGACITCNACDACDVCESCDSCDSCASCAACAAYEPAVNGSICTAPGSVTATATDTAIVTKRCASLKEEDTKVVASAAGIGLFTYTVQQDELVMNETMFKLLALAPSAAHVSMLKAADLNVHPDDAASFTASLATVLAKAECAHTGQSLVPWELDFRVRSNSNSVSSSGGSPTNTKADNNKVKHLRLFAEVAGHPTRTVITGGVTDVTNLMQSMLASQEMAALKLRYDKDKKYHEDMSGLVCSFHVPRGSQQPTGHCIQC